MFLSVLASDSGKDIKYVAANISIISEDVKSIYAAGARVSIKGKAKENVWVAGALVEVGTEIDGDLYAAGSNVYVKGVIAGVARVAGADIKIDAEIGEGLNAAAASIEISETAKLIGNTSLAAALIEFHGTASNNLSLYADKVSYSGLTSGSVTIEGRNVHLDDTAHIEGDLIIRSSEEAIISPDAKIAGKLTQLSLEDSKFFKEHKDYSSGRGFLLLLSASIFLLGTILIVFARGFVEQSISLFRTHPSRCILWGLLVFIGIPIFAIVAIVTIISIPIGVSTLFLLPFLLILGCTIATQSVSDLVFNRSSESKRTVQHLLFMAAGIITLVIVGFVPLIGGLLIWLALLFGLGAASITLGNRLSRKFIETN